MGERMIVLICGGRNFTDREKLNAAMDMLGFVPDMIVHGGAKGADSMSGYWAEANGIHFAAIRALWRMFDKAAGGLRNSAMLFLNINYCIAFPGGTGTADMVKKCRANGITVWLPYGV